AHRRVAGFQSRASLGTAPHAQTDTRERSRAALADVVRSPQSHGTGAGNPGTDARRTPERGHRGGPEHLGEYGKIPRPKHPDEARHGVAHGALSLPLESGRSRPPSGVAGHQAQSVKRLPGTAERE